MIVFKTLLRVTNHKPPPHKVEASIVDQVHFKLSLGSCNADMDGIYIVYANKVKVYVMTACE